VFRAGITRPGHVEDTEDDCPELPMNELLVEEGVVADIDESARMPEETT
jgi:hypothetical protein